MKGMLAIDVARCTACKTCELECAVAHSESKTLDGVVRDGELVQRRVVVEPAGPLAIPLQCRHCEDAPCIAVCPFGVIFMGRTGTAVVKCDLCIRRLAQGQQPACAAGCPTRAISFLMPEEVAKQARRKAAAGFLVAVGKGDVP